MSGNRSMIFENNGNHPRLVPVEMDTRSPQKPIPRIKKHQSGSSLMATDAALTVPFLKGADRSFTRPADDEDDLKISIHPYTNGHRPNSIIHAINGNDENATVAAMRSWSASDSKALRIRESLSAYALESIFYALKPIQGGWEYFILLGPALAIAIGACANFSEFAKQTMTALGSLTDGWINAENPLPDTRENMFKYNNDNITNGLFSDTYIGYFSVQFCLTLTSAMNIIRMLYRWNQQTVDPEIKGFLNPLQTSEILLLTWVVFSAFGSGIVIDKTYTLDTKYDEAAWSGYLISALPMMSSLLVNINFVLARLRLLRSKRLNSDAVRLIENIKDYANTVAESPTEYGLRFMASEPPLTEINANELCLYRIDNKIHYIAKDIAGKSYQGEITEGDGKDELQTVDAKFIHHLLNQNPLPTESLQYELRLHPAEPLQHKLGLRLENSPTMNNFPKHQLHLFHHGDELSYMAKDVMERTYEGTLTAGKNADQLSTADINFLEDLLIHIPPSIPSSEYTIYLHSEKPDADTLNPFGLNVFPVNGELRYLTKDVSEKIHEGMITEEDSEQLFTADINSLKDILEHSPLPTNLDGRIEQAILEIAAARGHTPHPLNALFDLVKKRGHTPHPFETNEKALQAFLNITNQRGHTPHPFIAFLNDGDLFKLLHNRIYHPETRENESWNNQLAKIFEIFIKHAPIPKKAKKAISHWTPKQIAFYILGFLTSLPNLSAAMLAPWFFGIWGAKNSWSFGEILQSDQSLEGYVGYWAIASIAMTAFTFVTFGLSSLFANTVINSSSVEVFAAKFMKNIVNIYQNFIPDFIKFLLSIPERSRLNIAIATLQHFLIPLVIQAMILNEAVTYALGKGGQGYYTPIAANAPIKYATLVLLILVFFPLGTVSINSTIANFVNWCNYLLVKYALKATDLVEYFAKLSPFYRETLINLASADFKLATTTFIDALISIDPKAINDYMISPDLQNKIKQAVTRPETATSVVLIQQEPSSPNLSPTYSPTTGRKLPFIKHTTLLTAWANADTTSPIERTGLGLGLHTSSSTSGLVQIRKTPQSRANSPSRSPRLFASPPPPVLQLDDPTLDERKKNEERTLQIPSTPPRSSRSIMTRGGAM